MSRLIKVGVVGAGFISQAAHLPSLCSLPGCQVTAIAELRPHLRERVASRFSIPKRYESHRELLQDSDVEAVIVVTARKYLGPIVQDCFTAGKHVLSEKPMAGTGEQAQQLLVAAESAKRHYVVGYMKRHDAGIVSAKEKIQSCIADNSFGKVLAVQARCFMGNSYCGNWETLSSDERIDGDKEAWKMAPQWISESNAPRFEAVLNTHSHVTNLLRFLFAEDPKVVFSDVTKISGNLAILKFANFNASFHFGCSSRHDWDEEIRVVFENGSIDLKIPPALLKNVSTLVTVSTKSSAVASQNVVSTLPPWSWAFRNQAEAFVAAISSGEISQESARSAVKDVLLFEELWKMGDRS